MNLQDTINQYWTDRAPSYDAYQQRPDRRDLDVDAWRRVWSTVLPPVPSDVLDVGTGSGHVAFLLAGLGHRVTGIDLSEGMLEGAGSMDGETYEQWVAGVDIDTGLKKGRVRDNANALRFVVYLADSLVNVLGEHVVAHGTTGKDRWLFAGEGNDPPHQNTVGYWWRKTLRDAGLSGIKLHDLRHFYASGLIAVGCDVVTVQRSLGHAKATTTLNTYAHLWPTAEDRTRKAAESIMCVSIGSSAEPIADLAASMGG